MTEPKYKPILFTAPMVRAILEGRKTQTRRLPKDTDKVFPKNDKYFVGNRLSINGSDDLIEITSVRLEKLQDISEEDAIAEGLKALTKDNGQTIKYGIPDADGMPGKDDFGWPWMEWNASPVLACKKLWEQINGPGAWDKNPWVWAIEFKRVEEK